MFAELGIDNFPYEIILKDGKQEGFVMLKKCSIILLIAIMATMGALPLWAADPVTLTFYATTSNKEYYEDIVAAYAKVNPDVKIEFNHYPNKEYDDKMLVALAGGQKIDIMTHNNVQNYSTFVDKNVLLQLDDIIAEDNYDMSFLEKVGYKQLYIDGKLYGMPQGAGTTWVLYYNKDVFDKAGVGYPKDDMTWAEFRELAKKVTSGEGNDKIWGTYIHSWVACWAGPALQTGATWLDDDLSPFARALQLRLDLTADGSAIGYFDGKASNLHYNVFNQSGKVAMLPIGNWHIGQLRIAEAEGKVDFDWDIVPMPHFEEVPANTTWGMVGTMSIIANSKHPKEAWEFMKFFLSDATTDINAADGEIPLHVDAEAGKALMMKGFDKPQNLGILFEQSKYMEWPAIPGIRFVDREIVTREAELSFGEEQRSAEETIKVIAERIKDEFKNK